MVGGDESAEQPLAAAAEAVVLTALGADPLAAILEHASVDGDATTLAFALACRVLNAARPAGKIRTRVIATLRNPQLQAWAASLGCPSPYPYWAEIHGLQGAAKFMGAWAACSARPTTTAGFRSRSTRGWASCRASV